MDIIGAIVPVGQQPDTGLFFAVTYAVTFVVVVVVLLIVRGVVRRRSGRKED